MTLRSCCTALAITAIGLVATPAASADEAGSPAGSITAASGATSATLSWTSGEYGGVATPQLTITRAGTPYTVSITDLCEVGCHLVADDAHTAPGTSNLKVADLDGDAEPEVLVDAFSGGAHCCVSTRVLTFDGSAYRALDLFWGDLSYTLRDADGDGRPELVGMDPRFSGAFTAFAASAFPVSVLQIEHGAQVDVTRRFPALIAKQAVSLRRDLRRLAVDDDGRGILAAYVADEYLLGRGKVGLREIDRQRRAGAVRRPFRALLLRRLHTWGYR
jgi:hypothetical protein